MTMVDDKSGNKNFVTNQTVFGIKYKLVMAKGLQISCGFEIPSTSSLIGRILPLFAFRKDNS